MSYSKEEAEYRPADTGEGKCRDCLNFIEPRSRCTLVAGSIDPDYTCEYWEPGKHFPAPVGSYGEGSPYRNGA